MEEGSLRCDANVSVRLKGAEKFGTKVEVKNVNSFRFVRAALEYEIERQIEVIESGGRVMQESRLWNANEGRTYSMRSKEQAHDYRYFPEPDLPPLIVSAGVSGRTREKLPELPEARRARMIAEYELNPKDAFTLTASREFADRFEAAARTARNPRRVANVLLSEVGGRLKALGLEQEQSPVSMAGIVQAADLLDEGKISSKQLKQLFDVCFEKGEDFPAVYEREKPQQITDASAIEALIDEVIAANPKQVEQYRAGKKTMAGFFVGQVMKASKGQANPALLNELVTKSWRGHTCHQGRAHHASQQNRAGNPHSSSSNNSSSSSSRPPSTRANSSGSTPTTSYSVPHSSHVTTSPSSTSSNSMSSPFSHSGQLGMTASSHQGIPSIKMTIPCGATPLSLGRTLLQVKRRGSQHGNRSPQARAPGSRALLHDTRPPQRLPCSLR
jgi:hypothetical protein